MCEVLFDNLWCRMAKLIAELSAAKLSIDKGAENEVRERMRLKKVEKGLGKRDG